MAGAAFCQYVRVSTVLEGTEYKQSPSSTQQLTQEPAKNSSRSNWKSASHMKYGYQDTYALDYNRSNEYIKHYTNYFGKDTFCYVSTCMHFSHY